MESVLEEVSERNREDRRDYHEQVDGSVQLPQGLLDPLVQISHVVLGSEGLLEL